MNAIARYLLVFLLGWSGAVWSYSDLIYKENPIPQDLGIPQMPNDISTTSKTLEVPTASSSFTQKNTEEKHSTEISNNKQAPEENTTDQ